MKKWFHKNIVHRFGLEFEGELQARRRGRTLYNGLVCKTCGYYLVTVVKKNYFYKKV